MMKRNNGIDMEYKTFKNMEDDIDKVLSAMGIEHVSVSDDRYATFIINVDNTKEATRIRMHLDKLQ